MENIKEQRFLISPRSIRNDNFVSKKLGFDRAAMPPGQIHQKKRLSFRTQ